MGRHGRHQFLLLLVMPVLACVPLREGEVAKATLQRYLEIELERLEETYRLLDRFATDIWPQWDNYHEIEVRVHFPNGVLLLVNPRSTVERAFKQVRNRAVHGKSIFINREMQFAVEPKPPLVGGRGRGGLTIRIDLRQLELPHEEPERVSFIETKLAKINERETQFSIEPTGDTDGYILMLVHEHFHGYQAKHGPREGGAEGLQTFEVSAEYATYSHIEGLALRNAYYEGEQREALEYLKDYLVARELKHELMPADAAAGEPYLALAEGPPSYVSLKMAMLVESAEYEPGISRESDPFFFNYKYLKDYYENILNKGLQFAAEWTLDKRGKYYIYGAYQCFLLDRFVPGWKRDFFQKKRNLDELIASFLDLSPEEKKTISSRLPGKYSYDDLYEKHDAVIKEKAKSEVGS